MFQKKIILIFLIIITCLNLKSKGQLNIKEEASRSKRQYTNINGIPSSSTCNCLSKYTPINCKCTGIQSINDELICRCDRASLSREEENKQQCPCRKGVGGGSTGWGDSDGYFPAYRGDERNSDFYPRAASPSSIHSACFPICHQSCLSTCTNNNKPYTREIDPYREREREQRYSSGYFVTPYANDQETENSLLAADYSPNGCQVSQCRANCLRACSRILDTHRVPYQETESSVPSHYEVRPIERPIYTSPLSSCQCSPDAICECPENCFPVCFDNCEANCDKQQIKTSSQNSNNQRRTCSQTCHFDCQRNCAEKQQQKQQIRRKLGGTEFSLGVTSSLPPQTSVTENNNNNEINNNLQQQQQTVVNGPATNCVTRCPKSCVVSCLSTQTNEDPTICVPACVAVCAQSCSRGLQHFDAFPQKGEDLIKSDQFLQQREQQIQQQIQQILLQGQRNEGLEQQQNNGTSYSNVTIQSEQNNEKKQTVQQPTMFLNDMDRGTSNDGLIRSHPCAPLCRPQCIRECTLKYVEERQPFSTYLGRKRGNNYLNSQFGQQKRFFSKNNNFENLNKGRKNFKENRPYPPHYILPLNEALKEKKENLEEENIKLNLENKFEELFKQSQNQNNTNKNIRNKQTNLIFKKSNNIKEENEELNKIKLVNNSKPWKIFKKSTKEKKEENQKNNTKEKENKINFLNNNSREENLNNLKNDEIISIKRKPIFSFSR